VAYYGREGLWALRDLESALRDLYARGFHFRQIFGEQGDWGVKSSGWGMAFLTPEWVLRNLCPDWEAVELRVGRVELNQDLLILRAR
jgi:hypothetical protein